MEWCTWQISNKKRYCIYPCISHNFNHRFQSQNKGHFRHSTSETHQNIWCFSEWQTNSHHDTWIQGIHSTGIWHCINGYLILDISLSLYCFKMSKTKYSVAQHHNPLYLIHTDANKIIIIIIIMLQHNHIKSMAWCKRLWQEHRVIITHNFKHFCSSNITFIQTNTCNLFDNDFYLYNDRSQ